MPVKNNRWCHRAELTGALRTLPPTSAVVSVDAIAAGVYSTGIVGGNELFLASEHRGAQASAVILGMPPLTRRGAELR